MGLDLQVGLKAYGLAMGTTTRSGSDNRGIGLAVHAPPDDQPVPTAVFRTPS
jgi:hypothetical protein